mgnify:CR=1 FL=1
MESCKQKADRGLGKNFIREIGECYMKKSYRTAGRDALGEFAPQFAYFNDDVLFGANWNNRDIDVKTRSIITLWH